MRLRTWLLAGVLAGSACESSNADLEARVKKLEDVNKKYAEALDALQQAYDAQKQQAAAQEEKHAREEPAPDAMFAVDIADDIRGGQVEGPTTAGVTVIEAWDFA
jgi:hypothetical protein